MTPNLGQGGCTALEDALVLGRSLQQAGAPARAAALQDALAGGGSSGSSQQQQAAAAAVREAIGRYERERTKRCLPLTIRSHLMGAALQVGRLGRGRDGRRCAHWLLSSAGAACIIVRQHALPVPHPLSFPPDKDLLLLPAAQHPQSALPPVVLARDLFVERAFSPAHFLDHAAYDCGRLEGH